MERSHHPTHGTPHHAGTQQRQQPSRAGPQVPVWKKQQSLADAPYKHELFDDGRPGFDEPYFTYD
jgi:hypothetical protein